MMMKRLKELWCEMMHDSMMWPIHGHYDCRACGHRRSVPWTSNIQKTRCTDLSLFTNDGPLAAATRR